MKTKITNLAIWVLIPALFYFAVIYAACAGEYRLLLAGQSNAYYLADQSQGIIDRFDDAGNTVKIIRCAHGGTSLEKFKPDWEAGSIYGDCMAAIGNQRIDGHKKAEEERIKRERERIRAEEQAKAQREAEAKLRAEAERKRIQEEMSIKRAEGISSVHELETKIRAEQLSVASVMARHDEEASKIEARVISETAADPIEKKINAFVLRVESGDMTLRDALRVAVNIGIEIERSRFYCKSIP